MLKPFAPAIQSFFCIGISYDDIFLGWVGIAHYSSLDGFYSASVSLVNYLGLCLNNLYSLNNVLKNE